MHHIAIDLGSRKSQICIRDTAGKIVEEQIVSTTALKSWLKEQPQGRVIVETCAESFAIAMEAKHLGHEVRVVPATLVKQLGVGERRLKNDQKDARKLSEVSTRIDLPSVHIPSVPSQRIREVCNMRETMVEARTKLVNSVRAYARMHVCELETGAAQSIPKRMRKAFGTDLPMAVERVLQAIESLNEQIYQADKEATKMAYDNVDGARLMTAPGVGPVTALRFASVVDEVGRFATAHQLESYLGLVPSESSTGQKQQRYGAITKAGAKKVRWALVQAVWSAKRHYKEDPMVRWAEKVATRRGKKIATVAMARKLAGVLFAMLRDGKDYDPSHLVSQSWKQLG
jgi:transposase